MTYQYVYRDFYDCCDHFHNGVASFKRGLIEEASYEFELAYESVKIRNELHNKYASFSGLMRVMKEDAGGLVLCRDAAVGEVQDADIYLNLARAEWHFKNRRKTVQAILDGLDIERRHPGLCALEEELGVRRRNAVPLLSRKNIFNAFLGRLMRRRKHTSEEIGRK